MTYPAPQASSFVVFGIAGLALLLAGLFVVAVHRALGRRAALWAAIGTAVWLGGTFAVSASGVLARFDARPPPFAFVFATVLTGGLAIGLSRVGKALSRLPLALLVGIHGFRFPLELVMNRAGAEGVMPVEMSFSGYNFDILTGITALLLAGLLAANKAPRAAVVAWNILGSVLLVTIAVIAFVSTPLIRAFGDAPEHVNTWVVYPPFIWLPAVMVLAAVAGHVIVARRLLSEPERLTPGELSAASR